MSNGAGCVSVRRVCTYARGGVLGDDAMCAE